MDNIFGIPVGGLMIGLMVALAFCLLMVAWVAWRRPVIFKLGVRNIPRRKAQTILIVVGLMLSTLIISAALGTGDTLDYSLTKDVYDNYGNVDTLVVQSQQVDAPYIDRTTKIDASTLALVESALDGNEHVAGIMPLLDEHVPAQNLTKSQAEPDVVLIGVDPARLDQFGGLQAADGTSIDLGAIAADGVVLSAEAADKLDAAIGDTIAVYYQNAPHELTVAGIAEDSYLSGYRRGREDYLEYPGLVMPLAAGNPTVAARLLGAAQAVCDSIGALMVPHHGHFNQIAAAARSRLGEEHFTTAWQAGAALPTELAVSEALAMADDRDARRAIRPDGQRA